MSLIGTAPVWAPVHGPRPDYSRIDAAFGTTATGWMNGDFNYDGSINGSDYTLIDNAFNTQSLILANPATTSAAPLAAVATAESKTKATSTAIATPTEATTTTTNFFSEKRVKGSLIMDVMELVAGK